VEILPPEFLSALLAIIVIELVVAGALRRSRRRAKPP